MKDWNYKEVLKHVYYEVQKEMKKKEQKLCTELQNSKSWCTGEDDAAYIEGLLQGTEETRKLFEDAMKRIAKEFRKDKE